MEIACENIDRLVTTEVRGRGFPRGIIYKLYEAAREKHPITFEMGQVLLKAEGKKIGITTGSIVPKYYPYGENDGPIGAMVLGRGLILSGYNVTFYTEEEIHPFLTALAETFGINAILEPLAKNSENKHANLAKEVDLLITIEKAGGNEKGHLHSIKGSSFDGFRANIDGWVQRMIALEKSVLSIGDGGNEVGFGKIYDRALEIIPNAKRCRCPCGGSVISKQQANYLLPASTSNWGAYGLTASFALFKERPDLFIHPSDEFKMLELAAKMDVRDGVTCKATNLIDGIPAETSAALVQILRGIIEATLTDWKRDF
jgi:hypothetical protein